MKIKKEKFSHHFVYYFKYFLILAILVVFVSGYFLFLLPQTKKMFSPELDLKKLEKDLVLRQEFLKKLDNFEKEWEGLSQSQLKRIDTTLPLTDKKLDYLALLDLFIQENDFSYSGLTFSSLKKEKKDEIQILNTSLNLKNGDYLSLKNFLKSLEKNLRLVDVDSLSFNLSSDSFNFKINTYFSKSTLAKEKLTWQSKLSPFDQIVKLINDPKFLDLKEKTIVIEKPASEAIGRSNPFIPF